MAKIAYGTGLEIGFFAFIFVILGCSNDLFSTLRKETRKG